MALASPKKRKAAVTVPDCAAEERELTPLRRTYVKQPASDQSTIMARPVPHPGRTVRIPSQLQFVPNSPAELRGEPFRQVFNCLRRCVIASCLAVFFETGLYAADGVLTGHESAGFFYAITHLHPAVYLALSCVFILSAVNLWLHGWLSLELGPPQLTERPLRHRGPAVQKRAVLVNDLGPNDRPETLKFIRAEVSARCMAGTLEEVLRHPAVAYQSELCMDCLGYWLHPETQFPREDLGGRIMPAKKKQTNKQAAKKTVEKTESVAVVENELMVSSERSRVTMSEDLTARISRVDALIEAAEGGKLTGRVPEIRSEHSCQWGKLLDEDVALRRQILTLKQKENMLLSLIRDRVAENVIDTADEAALQGVLKQPEA